MSNLILSKNIKEYLKNKNKVEKLTIGKNTFSLLVLEPSSKKNDRRNI